MKEKTGKGDALLFRFWRRSWFSFNQPASQASLHGLLVALDKPVVSSRLFEASFSCTTR